LADKNKLIEEAKKKWDDLKADNSNQYTPEQIEDAETAFYDLKKEAAELASSVREVKGLKKEVDDALKAKKEQAAKDL
jgi:hypothetical protein